MPKGDIVRATVTGKILKADDESDGTGAIRALVSAYDVKYRIGWRLWHTIEAGAFAASIAGARMIPWFWMHAWDALSPQMKQFVEMETHVYSDMHHAAIQKADQEAWGKFEADGTEVTRDVPYLVQSIRDPAAQMVKGYKPLMNPYKNLDERSLQALVEFIKSVP